MKQRARAWTHYTDGRETLAHDFTTHNHLPKHASPVISALRQGTGPETPHVRIFEMGSPRALKEPIDDLSEKRRRHLCSRDLRRLPLSFLARYRFPVLKTCRKFKHTFIVNLKDKRSILNLSAIILD